MGIITYYDTLQIKITPNGGAKITFSFPTQSDTPVAGGPQPDLPYVRRCRDEIESEFRKNRIMLAVAATTLPAMGHIREPVRDETGYAIEAHVDSALRRRVTEVTLHTGADSFDKAWQAATRASNILRRAAKPAGDPT